MPPARRPAWFYYFLIAGAALLLRLGAAAEMAAANGGRNSVFTPSKLSDLATYMELARQVAAGEFSGPFYYQPFYYAVFLPALRLISGGSVWAVIVAQALLGAAAVYLAGLIAAHLWSRRAGIFAAAMTALSAPLLLYTPFHQNETLQSFHLTLLFFLCLLAFRRGKWPYYLAAGAVLGIAVLTRGNAALFLPGILLFAVWSEWRRFPTLKPRLIAGGRSIAILLAAYLAPQLFFILHNSRLEGRLTGPSTAADAVLALGNTPEAPPGGRNPGLPAGPMEYPPAFGDFMARAAAGRSVPRQMFDYLKREPGAFLELQFRKLLLFWDYREIPNNVSIDGEGMASSIVTFNRFLLSPLLLSTAVAGLLSLGVVAVRRRRTGLLLLYYFILAYWAATALFYILSRFRAPILPLCFVAGGIFLDRAIRTFRRDRRSFYLKTVPALLAGLFLTVLANDFYRDRLERAAMRLVRPDGTRVELLDGRTMVLDNGPFSFGDWQLLSLPSGTTLEKSFANLPATVEAEVEIPYFCKISTTLRGRVNGVPFVFREAPDAAERLIRVRTVIRDGKLTLFIERNDEYFLFLDRQRDYGRTRLDGRPLPGELVVRVTFPVTEKSAE